MARETRRRVPRRYVVLAGIVAIVAASERFGGPLTIDRLRAASADGAEYAVDELRNRTAVGEIHLTFDDGPTGTTADVLDVLDRYDATAVFFPIGEQVEDHAAVLRRATDEGHRLGNHTWSHDRLVAMSPSEYDAAVGRTQIVIERATGVTPSCLRPPGGVFDEESRARAAADGLSIELWTVDPADWTSPGADVIVERVVDAASDGAVVLLHDGGGDRSQTLAALDDLLFRLSSARYRFTALPGC